MLWRMVMSEWSDEILFPIANADGYRLVFEAETWLRRMCLAALLAQHGPEWVLTIDQKLRQRLESHSAANSARWYLGVDADDDLLWSTTHGQLADLLRLQSIQPKLMELGKIKGDVLANRVLSISQVRNALAHNRAVSDDTMSILRGDITVLRAGWTQFKDRTLYDQSSVIYTEDPDVPNDLKEISEYCGTVASDRFADLRQQIFHSANSNFVSVVRLPVEPFGMWPNARRLHAALRPVGRFILCVMANKSGDEIQIVFPRKLPFATMQEIVDKFATREVLVDAWTDVPPEFQHPASVCWPKLWFYENRRPDHP